MSGFFQPQPAAPAAEPHPKKRAKVNFREADPPAKPIMVSKCSTFPYDMSKGVNCITASWLSGKGITDLGSVKPDHLEKLTDYSTSTRLAVNLVQLMRYQIGHEVRLSDCKLKMKSLEEELGMVAIPKIPETFESFKALFSHNEVVMLSSPNSAKWHRSIAIGCNPKTEMVYIINPTIFQIGRPYPCTDIPKDKLAHFKKHYPVDTPIYQEIPFKDVLAKLKASETYFAPINQDGGIHHLWHIKK